MFTHLYKTPTFSKFAAKNGTVKSFSRWLGFVALIVSGVMPASAATYFSQGSAGFSVLANWNTVAGGGGANPVAGDLTSGAHTFVVQNGNVVTVDQNIAVLGLTIGTTAPATAGSLVVGNNTTGRTITVNGSVLVNDQGSMTTDAANFANHTLTLLPTTAGNSLTVNGVLDLSFSTGSSTSISVTNQAAPLVTSYSFNGSASSANIKLGNLTVSPASSTMALTLGAGVTFGGNVTLAANGSMNGGAFYHYLVGNWNQASTTAYTSSGTIEFVGTSAQIVSNTPTSTSANFNNLVMNNNNGVVLFTSPVNILGNLSFTPGSVTTLQLSSGVSHTLTGNLVMDATCFLNQTSGTLTFNGSSAQNIELQNATFFNMTFSNGGVLNPKTLVGNLTCNGTMTINSTASVLGNGDHTISAGLTLNGSYNLIGNAILCGGNVQSQNATVNIGSANVIVQPNTPFGGGTVYFLPQSPSTNFTFQANSNVTVNAGGQLVINNNAFVTGQTGTVFSVNTGANLYLRGANNFPTGFGDFFFGTGTSTIYDAGINQTITGGQSASGANIELNNLTLGGAGTTKTLALGNLRLTGSLTLNSGITANLLGADVFIQGNVQSNATGINTINSDALFCLNNPNGNQTIGGTSMVFNLNNFLITNDSPVSVITKTINSNILVSGDFTATNTGGSSVLPLVLEWGTSQITNTALPLPALGIGTFSLDPFVRINTSGLTSFRNSIRSFLSTSLDPASTIRYNNGTQYTIQLLAEGITYGNLEIAGSGIYNYKSACGDLNISGNFSAVGGVPVLRDSLFNVSIGGDYYLINNNYPNPRANAVFTFNGNYQVIGNWTTLNLPNVVFGGVSGSTKYFNNTSGSVNVYGDLTIENNIIVDANTRSMQMLKGNFINTDGIFLQTTGTTTFNAPSNFQSITTNASSSFGNLTMNKTGTNTGPSPTQRTLQLLSNVNVVGSLNFTANASDLDMSNITLSVGGNINYGTGATANTVGSTLAMNGNVAQTFTNTGAIPSLNNLVFSGSGSKALNTNTYNLTGYFQINSSVVTSGVVINLQGDWINNGGTFNHTSTVNLNGVNQNISASNFNNLTCAGTAGSTKTLLGAITINGSLLINANIILDVTALNQGIAIGGNYTNNGTFLCNTGTVTFIGGGKSIISGGTGIGKQFYNINVSSSTGSNNSLSTNDLYVINDLTISSGNLVFGNFNVTVGANLLNSEVINMNGTGALNLIGSAANLSFDPGLPTSAYRVININAASAGVTYSLINNNITTNNSSSININTGKLKLNGRNITMSATNGNVNIAAAGTLDVDAGAQLLMGNGGQINNNGGALNIVGNSINVAQIGRSGTGAGAGYTINQNSGTFSARFYLIDGTTGNGLTIAGTSTVNAGNNLSNGTFNNGSGTAYITLTNWNFTPDFTINNAAFNAGPTRNVSRNSLTATGIVTFNGSTGSLAGPTFELDLANQINWTSSAKRWTNSTGDNLWLTAGNWDPAVVPTSGDTVYLDRTNISASYSCIINGAAQVGRLVIDNTGSANSITLTINSGNTLDVSENLNIINANASLVQQSPTSILNVGGSFINTGTYTANSGAINFNGGIGNYQIAPGSSQFFDLNFTGSGTYTLSSNITINNNLSVTGGTLDVSTNNYTITVGGNWTNSSPGVFIPRNGRVLMNKAGGTQTLTGGPFFNFVSSGTSTKVITTNTNFNGTVRIGPNSTINGGNNLITVLGNWSNFSTTGFTQTGGGTVQFTGTATQIIDTAGTVASGTFAGQTGIASTFNNIVLANTGGKTIGRGFSVAGNFSISSGCGNVNTNTVQITGTGSGQFAISGAANFFIQGANNFPSGFGSVSLASNSTILYQSDVPQTVFATTYGNLDLRRLTAATNVTKTLAGNITILGNLNLSADNTTQLDATDRIITLNGAFSFAVGGRRILWGTTGTLNLVGPSFNFPAAYTGFGGVSTPEFNNVIVGGTGTKTMLAPLNFSGDLTIENGITFNMQAFALTGTASQFFNLQGGATLNCAIPAPALAFPTGFSSYTLNLTSITNLNAGGGGSQLVSNAATYGVLNLTNTGTSTLSGNLVLAGNFTTNGSTLQDAGFNITSSGASMDIRLYTPSATSTITLNGNTQAINDGSGGTLDLNNLVFASTGTKTLAQNAGNIINIGGTVTINSGVVLSVISRNLNFSGSTWTNNGSYQHTGGGTFTFNGTGAQNINFGATHTVQPRVVFSNTAGPVTFIGHGGNFTSVIDWIYTPTFTINAGAVVNMGSLTHNIAGTVQNNGTWNTTTANFNFTGTAHQTVVTTGTFTAQNVTIASTNGRIMLMNTPWSVNNLTIGTSASLNTNTVNHSITLTGNWLNSGGFTTNSAIAQSVFFESNNTSTRTIDNGTAVFRDVFFNQTLTAARTYQITNTNLTINRQLTIGNGASLDLNGNTLTLGSNNALVEVHNVQSGGSLLVSNGATLRFNNDNGNSTLNVSGTLLVKGTNPSPSRITRSTTNNRYSINILSGATVKARYYGMEFLSDNGFDVQAGATVDATDNFSDGAWSNLNTAAGAAKYYLTLNGTVTTTIQNITFNFVGTPTIGVHFNVRRTASPFVQIDEVVGGAMGTFQYEGDDNSASTGNLRWPTSVSVTWTGAVSSDWHNAGNWSPAIVPSFNNNVNIPSASNAPILSAANGNCKVLTISNGFLTINNNRTLTVSSDTYIGTGSGAGGLSMGSAGSSISANGSWFVGSNGFFTGVSGSTVTFTASNGTLTISMNAASSFQNLVLNGSNSVFFINGSFVTINGNLTLQAGTYFPNTAGYSHFLKGNFTNSGGIFSTQTGGTFTLNGTGNQNVTYGVFSNLTLTGGGTKQTFDSCRVMGNLTINSGPTLTASINSIWDLRGNVTINTGGSFNDGGNTHFFTGGTWTATGSCVQNTGTIRFNRNGTQNLNGGTFNNLLIDGFGAKIVNGNVGIYEDVTMGSGIAYLNVNTSLISSLNGVGTFSMPAGGNLYIRGAANCPSNFGAYDFNITSNTFYDVLLDQQVGPIAYGNLVLNTPSIKSLQGNTTVKGTLTFNTSTLDVTSNNYTLFIGGNFNNNSTGSFLCNQGEVIFNAPASFGIQYIFLGLTGVKTFFDLTVNRPTGSQTQINNNNSTILGTLRVEEGNFTINGNTCTVSGSILATQGTILTAGTYVMNNSSGTPSLLQTNNSALNVLTVSLTNGSTVTLQDNLTISGNFSLTSGTFDGNGKEANLGSGSNTINIQGTYIVGAGGKLGLGNGATCTVQSGATLEVVGSASSIARVSNTASGGRYNLAINGTLKAQFYLFEFMNTGGIRIQSSGTVDNTNNLSDGTFTNGASGGVYLQMDNSQTLTINNATFSINPGGSARNVAKSVNAGLITFTNYNGIFSGPLFENDPNNRINWTAPSQVQWSGSISTDWFNPGNWNPNVVPTSSIDALIATASNQPIITIHGAQTKKLTLNANTSLTINIVGPVTLPTGVTVANDLDLIGTIYSNGPSDTLRFGGNFNKASGGNFYPGNSTVVFNSAGGTRTINNGTAQFNNVIINSPATYLLGANTALNGDLTITQGTLDATSSNFQISLLGNWTNNGTFTPRNGTVLMNNNLATAKSINNGSSWFGTLSINSNAGATYNVVTNNLRTTSNLVLNLGKLNLNNLTFFNGDNVGLDAVTLYDQFNLGNNGTILNGTNSTISVNSGGNLVMVGSSSVVGTKISRQTTGNYSFIVNSGGTISAQNYLIEYVNASGVQIRPGATINGTFNFSNGQFANGAPGGTYLNLQNDFANFTILEASFSSGPANNVTRPTGTTGIVTLKDASGALSGYLFENDDPANGAGTGNIRWTYTNLLYDWTGNVNTDWNNPANWNDLNGISAPAAPDASVIANIPNVSSVSGNFPVLNSGANGACKNLIILSGATLTLSNNLNLTVSGSLNNSGTLTVGPTSTSTITVSDLWANTGTFNPGQSTVVMTAASGNYSLTTSGSPFFNLTLNGGANFQTMSVLDINNNLTISAGSLQVTNSAHQINVGGNWTNNATFSPGSGTVNFNRTSGTQTITDPTGESFTNLRLSNSGSTMKTVSLSCPINIVGSLEIADVRCTLNAGANTINLSGNWTNSGAAFASTGTVNLVGTNLQSINRSNAAGESFVNLTLNNANGARILSNVTLTGNLTLTNGTFDASSRNLNLAGTSTPLAGSNITGNGGLSMTSGSITLTGQNNHTGTFTKGTGTFTYAGPAGLPSQTIRAVDYHNLASSSTGARVLASTGTIGISGAFTVGSNSYTVTGSTVNFNGTASQTIPAFQYNNLTSSSTGARILGIGANIRISGVFTTGTNTYTPGTSTLEFNGTSAQNLSAITCFNLLKSGTGDLNLTGNITVNGSLNVSTGTLNTSSNQITGNATGLFTLAANTTLTLGSTSSATNVSFPTSFTAGNTTLNCASTVVYQANTSSQVINNSVTYGNLSVLTGATSATKALSSGNALTLCGLNTGTGATFNASSASSVQLNGNYGGTGNLQLGSNTMNITGDWTNTGSLTPGTSTVNYSSNAAQTLAAVNYFNLTSSGSGARTLASSGTIGVAGAFTPGTNSYTNTGSTMNFNGSGAQTIPVFNYFNLGTSSTGARTLATTSPINIAGNFTPGSNTFNVVNSTVAFNGTGTQTAGSFNFFNLTVNKASGEVQATGNQTVIGTMTLTSGDFNSNGQVFKLKSNSTGTARLAAVTGSSQFIGNMSMERYVADGNTGWAFLGTPVTNSTVNDWTDNFPTSGFPGATGFAGGSFVSMYSYNESATGSASNGYAAPTSGSQALVNGKGYWVYLGRSFPLADTITVITTGTPQIGTKDFGVTYTSSGGVSEDGWNLVANPFPSTIDWMSSNWDKTNIADGFYVMNRNTRSYASFVNGVGTNGATRYIGSSQGFLVKATASNPILRVYETAKASVEPTFLRTASSNANETLFRINLNRTGTLYSDESVLRFNEQASTGFDQLLDGLKLYNTSPNAVNISSMSEGLEYSINALPELTNATQVPVKVSLPESGMYTMEFDGIQDLQAAYGQAFGNDYLVLVDNQSGTEINLNTTGSYNFAAAPGDSMKMFTLRFHNPVITQIGQVKTVNQEVEMGRDANGLFANFNFKEGQQVEVRLVNAIGQEMEGSRSQWIQQGKIYLNPGQAPEGIYFMQVRYGDRQITEKFKL